MPKWMVTTKMVSVYTQLIEADTAEAAKLVAAQHSHSDTIGPKGDTEVTVQLASVGQSERYADRLIRGK